MKILKTIKKRKYKKLLAKYSENGWISLNASSIYGNAFRIELRHPEMNRNYLSIGENSVVEGHFIFERETGNITVGKRVHIGASTFISIDKIEIGNDVTIAWDCLFYDHNSHSIEWNERKNDTIQELSDIKTCGDPIRNKNWDVVKSKPIIIQDKAWIGVGCKILKGVTIGEGAVVAAGSVVTKNVEPWTVVGGNPAIHMKNVDNCIGSKNE